MHGPERRHPLARAHRAILQERRQDGDRVPDARRLSLEPGELLEGARRILGHDGATRLGEAGQVQ